jgi:AcrR family transcriptional regulator
MPMPAAETLAGSSNRRPEKSNLIIEAAGQLFLEQGYGAVSMDQIAKVAGVSKATVYAHFESKDRLFAAVIQTGCSAYAEGIVPAIMELTDIRESMTRIAAGIESFLLAPKTLGIYRVIIAEGPRFPELVQAFVNSGPLPFLKLLTDFFQRAHDRNMLKVPNPRLAAHQLVWLVRGPLYMRRMLNLNDMVGEPPAEEVIAGAVDMLLKAYAV